MEYITNQAFKAKLPTLLQSNARPDVFYSGSGLTLRGQAEAGFLRDISDLVSEQALSTVPEATIDAHWVDGELVGMPLYASGIVFCVNTELTKVEHTQIKSWNGFPILQYWVRL